jgi:hypothetical protein
MSMLAGFGTPTMPTAPAARYTFQRSAIDPKWAPAAPGTVGGAVMKVTTTLPLRSTPDRSSTPYCGSLRPSPTNTIGASSCFE